MLEFLISDCLKNGQIVRFRASGNSMHPTIRQDEVVVVTPVEAAHLALGDIVLSRCGEKLTAHRLVRFDKENRTGATSACTKRRSMYILRGDACNASDLPIAASRIVGKVIAVERRGRLVNPYGRRSEWGRRIYRFGIRLKSILPTGG